jgi:hypothetical protein
MHVVFIAFHKASNYHLLSQLRLRLGEKGGICIYFIEFGLDLFLQGVNDSHSNRKMGCTFVIDACFGIVLPGDSPEG